jgi:class 3 adenylate cyclase/tetratricopeptide (TPR) repeat protein
MKCPKCQSVNPDAQKFCGECGAKLEKACPNCGCNNPPQYKFCGECGHNLTLPPEPAPRALSLDEKIEKIQRYLPRGLTEKILSQRDRIEGERKQVTVMFCDMEGFTPLTEKLGADEAYGIMDQVYEILIHKVHHYEGTVNEMTGDGIMALFGAPIALEDAPQRAIRSAMRIHREMTLLNDRIRENREDMPPIKMRVGIHTGPVVVGTLGNDLRVEFKAVGDTVNLASRMEGLAQPGATYVTEDVFRLTEGFFRFEALGEKKVKGKVEPIKVYRVLAPSSRRTRFDVSAERGLTPLVARERELALLLDGFERVKSGSGKAFSIVSEAGGGKSRLLYEFRKAVSNEYITFLEGKCLSYSRGVAYHPVIDILKSNFDIHDGDENLEIREKVKRGLKILGVEEASTLPYVLELLSVKESGIDRISMSPEAKRDRIIEAIKRITLKGSEIRPLIMAIEDLHWMDGSSEDFCRQILESIPGARVLLIFTYRPEFLSPWVGKSFHSQLTLDRFSELETRTMVSHLLGAEELDEELQDLILEKTEGVPFFIEEFVKSLKDLKIIERKDSKYVLAKDTQAVTIPSTIQDVIMARVDTLPEGAKEVLQIGSVIEREFSYALIERVTSLPERDLLSHLSLLKESELLYERGIYPENTYVFKHALTREVVYDSILSNKRKKLHEKIGNAIEDLYRVNIDELYGVLTEHYIAAECFEKAAKYSELAADSAERAGAINVAISYAKKRVTCLERLPRTDDVLKKIVHARISLGLYMLRLLYYDEAMAAIEPIVELALRSSDKKAIAQTLTIIGSYEYFIKEDITNAFEHLKEAVRISEELGDNLLVASTSWRLGAFLSLNSEFEKAVFYYERVRDINVAANSLWGISVAKSYLSLFGYSWWGKVDPAYQTSIEAVGTAEESGDIYSKAVAYTVHGISCYGKGFFQDATTHLLRGADFSERINYAVFSAITGWMLGELYYEMGEYEHSRNEYAKAVRLIDQNRSHPSWLSLNKIGVEMAKLRMNAKDTDLESLYAYAYENKMKVFEGWKFRYIGEILLNIDDQSMSEAEHWIKRTIETHKRDDMMWFLARDYTLYAELLKRKADKLEAMANLIKAIKIFEECGADGWVTKVRRGLESLS